MNNLLTAVIVAVACAFGAFAAVYFGKYILRRLQVNPDIRARIRLAWAEVEDHIDSNDETHWRMAVIKADAVLDMGLMAKAFPGRTLNDRLKFAIHKYHNLRRVRWAHGLRNTLAHEPMNKLTNHDAIRAVSSFRAALYELGVL